MPTRDLDIYRTAKILIDAHGENASLEAAQRTDQAIEEGSPEAEIVWVRVMKAIEVLQRREIGATEFLH